MNSMLNVFMPNYAQPTKVNVFVVYILITYFYRYSCRTLPLLFEYYIFAKYVVFLLL